MGGFLHSRRFALSVYEVALIDTPPAPTTRPPRECQRGKKKKKKLWICGKLKSKFPTSPQLLLLLLLLLSTSPVSVVTLLLPDPPRPAHRPKV